MTEDNVYWFSCPKFTVMVVVNEMNIIIDAAPIVSKFIGQPRGNLKKWASKFGKVEIRRVR